jgi:pimeloyl-ACP methyl ester carboxylesterase
MEGRSMNKTRLTFESNGTRCAATLYRPAGTADSVPCVVMGHGFTGTQDQLAPYAERFTAAGLAVLTFDYRHFGESEGQPRQIVDLKKQLEDWRAAIALARTVEGVDPQRIALWGSSLSGGHVINLAAEDPTLAAVVVQVPAIDKSTRGMSKEAKAKMEREGISLASLIGVSLRSIAGAIDDAVRGLLGRSPHYMRVFGRPGEVAAFTDLDSDKRLQFFTESGPTWRNEFAPRFLFGTPKYRKGTAERVRMPLLVCVAELDTEADPELARKVARDAPRGELKTYPVSHFDAYVAPAFLDMVTDQIEFLRRTLASRDTRDPGSAGSRNLVPQASAAASSSISSRRKA